jgi:predicted O-methyltransferase YrrM
MKPWTSRLIPEHVAAVRDRMFDLAAPLLGDNSITVEIGSDKGWWAHRFLKQLPGRLYCVDIWAGPRWRRNELPTKVPGTMAGFYVWLENVHPWFGTRCFPLRGFSDKVRYKPKNIDFLFVDGGHTYRTVLLDLKTWVPRVRQGGLIVGHDWDGKWASHVRRAVKKYWPDEKIMTDKLYHEKSTCWYRYR